MRSNKGFTLIEMAVVLAVIAILAAVMTPIVTGYIDQARTARATTDVSSIGSAILLHYRDTGRMPIYDTAAVAATKTPSKNCMVSGTGVALPTAPAGTSHHASWATLCSTVGNLRSYLNINSLGVTTGNPANGAIAYRGPYLDGLDAADPWGQAYVVTTAYLGANETFWGYVLSAGPNQDLDSNATQPRATAPLATTSDDITALIR